MEGAFDVGSRVGGETEGTVVVVVLLMVGFAVVVVVVFGSLLSSLLPLKGVVVGSWEGRSLLPLGVGYLGKENVWRDRSQNK